MDSDSERSSDDEPSTRRLRSHADAGKERERAPPSGPSFARREAPAEQYPPRKRDRLEMNGAIYDRFGLTSEKHVQLCKDLNEVKKALAFSTSVLAKCQNIIDPR